MKRRLRIVAVFLLAGAVVNVGVAWGVCYLGFTFYDTLLSETEAADLLTSHVDVPVGVVQIEGHESRAIGVWRAFASGSLDGPLDGPPVLILVAVMLTESGWPAKIMGGRVLHVNDEDDFQWMTSGRAIPLRPIWPGFVANTLFYSTLLWLPFVLRRFIRVRRGLCPACAYPRGESAVCSECGRALQQRQLKVAGP